MPSKQLAVHKQRAARVEKDMKFAFKSIVAAAAFIAAGASNAALVTVNAGQTVNGLTLNGDFQSFGALRFDDNLVDALNLGVVTASGFGGAEVTTVGKPGEYAYGGIIAKAAVTSVTYDDVTGKVTRVVTTGGARQTATNGLALSGGWVEVGNLDVRLDTLEIFGTVQGQSVVAGSVAQNYSGKLFDIQGGVTGDTTWKAGFALNQISGLAITTQAFSAIDLSLGLKNVGRGGLQAAAANFGRIDSQISVSATAPAVPEPSTYALMGVGLVGLALVSRRRAAK